MKKNRVISAFILLLLFVFSSSAVVTAEEKKIRLNWYMQRTKELFCAVLDWKKNLRLKR